ncbi:tetratricopeptide repeat protein [uncultured Nonlabens sp.]|uniref:tetratricopeptide repeat protein n=1 Tax=uncultured Nonlabens sp. TaxID=859306 RepID=UPI0026253B14|nr:tetratricopeptide repeat protein [uncultured Nonlabens sp.]
MKFKLTITFLAMASLAVAQKKEIKKITKAAEKGEFSKAQKLFNSIDESAVEAKYAGAYEFFKVVNYIDLTGVEPVSLDNLRKSESAIANSKYLGYSNLKLEPILQNFILNSKLQIANDKVKSGDTDTALKLVEELYQSNPENLDMLYNAGNLAYSSAKYDVALKKYSELLEKGYTGVKTTYVATNLNGVVEKFASEQVRDYSVQVKTHTNPDTEKSISNLGDIVLKTVWLHVNKENKIKAKEVYETAFKNYPSDSSLKLVKPDILLTLGMMEEYKEAIENMDSEVTDPKVFDNLGVAAIEKKNYESAIRYFKSSLKLESNNYYALVNLSNAYLESGNLEKSTVAEQKNFYNQAISCLEKAHVLRPDEKGVKETLVSLYDFLGMTDKSAQMKSKM